MEPAARNVAAYRGGRILQVLGLIIGLEALLVFGSEPREGPEIYTALAAVAVFYLGTWLTRRHSPKLPTAKK